MIGIPGRTWQRPSAPRQWTPGAHPVSNSHAGIPHVADAPQICGQKMWGYARSLFYVEERGRCGDEEMHVAMRTSVSGRSISEWGQGRILSLAGRGRAPGPSRRELGREGDPGWPWRLVRFLGAGRRSCGNSRRSRTVFQWTALDVLMACGCRAAEELRKLLQELQRGVDRGGRGVEPSGRTGGQFLAGDSARPAKICFNVLADTLCFQRRPDCAVSNSCLLLTPQLGHCV